MLFGKTKLCPEISPKKTVEGLIGGVISNGILMLIISLFYQFVLKGEPIHYLGVLIAGMLAALIGLVGDLTASVIKRQTAFCSLHLLCTICSHRGLYLNRKL